MESYLFYNHFIDKTLENFLEENEALIWRVAHDLRKKNSYKMKKAGIELEDLYSEAKIQFIKCYNNYNNIDYCFSTYYYKSAMLFTKNYINKENGIIKIPLTCKSHAHFLKKLKNKYGENNSMVTLKVIMEECHITEKQAKYIKLKYDLQIPLSLSTTLKTNTDSTAVELIDTIPSSDIEFMNEEKVIYEDFYQRLIKKLSITEKEVLELKLKSYENVEISKALGCSRQYIYQISNQLKNKFKKMEQQSI